REKFTNTDMAKQKQLLREGITFMIMFNDGGAMAEQKIRGLGASHSEQRMNIDPALYSFWLDALLTTIAKHDKNFSPELDKAWRRVLGKGIEMMRSMYKTSQPALV
ncbi:MAG TPA: globin, partial [Pirellulaceae bacterium]|nr:globin [Pirellulaceae bacterium]